MNAATKAICMALLFYWQLRAELQQALNKSCQDYNTPIRLSPLDDEGGAQVVEHSLYKLEPNSKEIQRISRDRRLVDRVGSSLPGHQDWRPLLLIQVGTKPPHQLSRDAGSTLGL